MTTDGATTTVRLRPVDLLLICATATAMVTAVALKLLTTIGRIPGSAQRPHLGDAVRYAGARPDLDTFGLANWASGAAGIGVLLLATTLVVVAVGPWGRPFAVVVGVTAVVISLGAVALALAATHAAGPETAFQLGTWRTGLAAIAGACLPAVFAAAVRAAAAHQRG